jgi:hypothetical protein
MKVLRILKSSNKESCSLFNSLQINILFGIFRAQESIFWIISFSNEFELIQILNSISTVSTVNPASSARIAGAWCSPITVQRHSRHAASSPCLTSYAIRPGHPLLSSNFGRWQEPTTAIVARSTSSLMTAHLIAPPPQPSHGKVARKHLGPLRENLIANEPAAFPFFPIVGLNSAATTTPANLSPPVSYLPYTSSPRSSNMWQTRLTPPPS